MVGLTDKENHGIIPNAFDHIYGCIDDQSNLDKKFLVRCSYVEIYNEEIRDLLGPDPNAKLDLKENPQKGVFVKDLTIITVKSIREIDEMMNKGNSLRIVGQTAMNDTSSRSHSLFTIYIETAETVSTSPSPHVNDTLQNYPSCTDKKQATLQGWQTQPRRLGRLREAEQDASDRHQAQGGHQNQLVPLSPR